MKRSYFSLFFVAIMMIVIACGTNGDTNTNILSSENDHPDLVNTDNLKSPSSTVSCGFEIFSHSVVYYPDFLVPPKEFDADVTLNMNLYIYSPSEVTIKRQIKIDDGPWYPWHNWYGQWESQGGGNYAFEAPTDGLYGTTYHHRVKIVVNSTGQSSPIYEFSLYYNGFINP